MQLAARRAWHSAELCEVSAVICGQLLPALEASAARAVCHAVYTPENVLVRAPTPVTPAATPKSNWSPALLPPELVTGSKRMFSSLPAHSKLAMPALSPTMTQGNVVKWHVREGDEVSPGAALADIETDKATLVFENQEDGFIAKILVPEGGRDIPVGAALAILVEEAADVEGFKNYSEGGVPAALPASEPAAPAAPAGGSGKTYPAHSMMNMPALSPTMTQGNIIAWHVKEGTTVSPGDVLADIETDKATLAFENQEEGVIAKILFPGGAKDVPVGAPLIILVDDEALVAEFADFTPGGGSAAAPTAAAAPAESAAAAPAAAPSAPRTPASSTIGPAAKKLLAEAGLTVADVEPTGPKGIVTKGDVLAAIAAGVKPGAHSTPAAAAPPPAAKPAPTPPKPATPSRPPPPKATGDFVDIPNTQIRQIIARRLLESKQTIPAMYVTSDVDLDAVTKLRKTLAEQGTKLSVNDFVVRAAALAIRDVAGANAFWNTATETINPLSNVDISIAVATPAGLITPIVRDADKKSISMISKEVKDLAGRARDNKLKPEEFTGGSFTISNLGMFGIKQFSAIINPPQAAILAVGGSRSVTDLTADGKLFSKSVMSVTLSADNRAYDEEVASKLLEVFATYMANPLKLML